MRYTCLGPGHSSPNHATSDFRSIGLQPLYAIDDDVDESEGIDEAENLMDVDVDINSIDMAEVSNQDPDDGMEDQDDEMDGEAYDWEYDDDATLGGSDDEMYAENEEDAGYDSH